MKKILFIISLILIVNFVFAENWQSIGIKGIESDMKILSHSNTKTLIHVSIADYAIDKGLKDYSILKLKNCNFYTDEIGLPEIPYYRKLIAIPDKGQPIVTIKNIKTIKLEQNIKIQPAQAPLPDIKNYSPQWNINNEFYNTDEFFPKNIVEIKNIGTLRSFRTALIYIYPIKYNPKTGETEIIYDFDIEIEYAGKGENEMTREIPITERWIPIYELMLWNWNYVKNTKSSIDSKIINNKSWNSTNWFNEGDYLIIVVSDEMTQKIKELAAWKTKLGYRPVIKQVQNTITPAQLHDTILYCYNNWSIPPEFVLIVGEGEENEVTNHIEAHQFSAPYTYGVESGIVRNDHYFSLMPDTTDRHSDLFVGRISARDSNELGIWINKVIEYEKNPPSSSNWYESYFGIGGIESGRIFDYTARQFALNLVNDGNFTDLDTLIESNYADGAMRAHVLDSIDDGHNIFVFRGHGDEGSGFGWYGGGDNGYDDMFLRTDVPLMSTTSMGMGFVFAPTCLAANFTYPNYESMGELMINMTGKGITGYYGATNVSYSFYNDSMALGISHGLTGSSTTREFQVVCVYGKNYMETYSSGSASTFELEMYLMNTMGDPACRIWTKTPDTLFVQHDVSYPIGPVSMTLYAYDQNNNPVANAIICVWDTTGADTTCVSGTTDATGYVTLNPNFIDADGSNEVMITGSKENYIPYESAVPLVADCPAKPNLYSLFDYARTYTLTPNLTFSSTDPDGDNIEYLIYYDTLSNFSTADSTFTNLYSSGDTVDFTFPISLLDNKTYYWKVKARDPSGSNLFSPFSEIRTFSISTSQVPTNTVSWYQTTNYQFNSCTFNSTYLSGDSVVMNTSSGYSSDTIFNEDFESGSVPSGWTIINGDGDSYQWVISAPGNADLGGYDPPNPGNYQMFYDDDDAGSGNSTAEEYAISPKIAIPTNIDSLILEYGYGYRDYTGEVFYVQVRALSNGTWSSWTTEASYNVSTSGTERINITSYLPCDSVQIQWVYDDNGNWGWAAAFDNVYIITKSEIILTSGDMYSPVITYEDISSIGTRTNWGYAFWKKSNNADSISVQFEYMANGTWAYISDSDLPNNSTGFFTNDTIGSVDLTSLNTAVYDSIRIRANFYRAGTKATADPSLFAWEVGNENLYTALHSYYCNALIVDQGVKLLWQPDYNYSPQEFRIYRSEDNKHYELIANVSRKYNSYIDKTVDFNKWYYYKVAQVSDEKTIYFKPIKIFTKQVFDFNLSVNINIINDKINIIYSTPYDDNIKLSIYDIMGREVYSLINGHIKKGIYNIKINKNNFSKGLYFIKITNSKNSITKKIIILK